MSPLPLSDQLGPASLRRECAKRIMLSLSILSCLAQCLFVVALLANPVLSQIVQVPYIEIWPLPTPPLGQVEHRNPLTLDRATGIAPQGNRI